MTTKPVLYHGDNLPNLPAWWVSIDDPDARDRVFSKSPEYYDQKVHGKFVVIVLEKDEAEYIEKYKDSYPYLLFFTNNPLLNESELRAKLNLGKNTWLTCLNVPREELIESANFDNDFQTVSG